MIAFIAGLIYKTLALVAGTAFGFMGFKLFDRGVFGDQHVAATFGSARLLLKKAAPGTVFAVFGGIIIWIALFRSVTYDEVIGASAPPAIAEILDKLADNKRVTDGEFEILRNWAKESHFSRLSATAENTPYPPTGAGADAAPPRPTPPPPAGK